VPPIVALAVTAGVVLLAAVIALVVRATTGRARRTPAASAETYPAGSLPGLDRLAPAATLVQLSTQYCAQCPATRRLLSRLTEERGGIAHVDVDLTADPDLARRLHVLQTPTVLVLDGTGRLVARIGGAPRRDEVVALLDTLAPLPERSPR
jgi:thiol-disulfide isomerase/thioredoxin